MCAILTFWSHVELNGGSMQGNDLKYMKAAIAVAEELSFSRAAKRMHLSQPAITKYIAELEEMLGVILFLRDHRIVALTDAGRAYVEEARIAVLHTDRAVQAARAAGHDMEMVLNVGRTPYADPFYTSTLLTMRLPLFPRMRLNLFSGFSCDLVHDVLAGELDAAVVIEPPESGQLTSLKIDESPLFVVMSREDRLASLPSVRLEDLAARHWMIFQRNSHPPVYDLIFKCAQDVKAIPAAVQHFMVPEETIPLLINPHGIVIAPKSGALRIARDGYTMRPLEEGRLMMRTLLISRSDNASPALSELVRGFMRRMKQVKIQEQMSLPIPV
jgi:DNA-binding transcriptional LysR family regulator